MDHNPAVRSFLPLVLYEAGGIFLYKCEKSHGATAQHEHEAKRNAPLDKSDSAAAKYAPAG